MKPEPPDLVKYFIGLLYADEAFVPKATAALVANMGAFDYESPEFEFGLTTYYEAEMGAPLFRRFLAIEALMSPGELARVKLLANEIETQFAVANCRRVNLDPGYMDCNKVILASAKYNSQKIYLEQGIYADPTLWYEKGRFTPYGHAFPDFKSGVYQKVFQQIRALYKAQSKGSN